MTGRRKETMLDRMNKKVVILLVSMLFTLNTFSAAFASEMTELPQEDSLQEMTEFPQEDSLQPETVFFTPDASEELVTPSADSFSSFSENDASVEDPMEHKDISFYKAIGKQGEPLRLHVDYQKEVSYNACRHIELKDMKTITIILPGKNGKSRLRRERGETYSPDVEVRLSGNVMDIADAHFKFMNNIKRQRKTHNAFKPQFYIELSLKSNLANGPDAAFWKANIKGMNKELKRIPLFFKIKALDFETAAAEGRLKLEVKWNREHTKGRIKKIWYILDNGKKSILKSSDYRAMVNKADNSFVLTGWGNCSGTVTGNINNLGPLEYKREG